MENPLLFSYYQRLIPIAPLILIIISIILGFNCIWRVHRKLKTFLILLTMALISASIRVALEVFVDGGALYISSSHLYLDIIAAGLFVAALAEMYRLIRSLDGEAPIKN